MLQGIERTNPAKYVAFYETASVVTIGTNTEANWKTQNHAGKIEQSQLELLLTPREYGRSDPSVSEMK